VIKFDLNTNDCEALLRQCESFVPARGDPREARRIEAALKALAEALVEHLRGEPLS
jgi:predicted membrane chloride channel (bestrophin family)